MHCDWRQIVRTLVRRDVNKPLIITTILLSPSMLSGGTTLTYLLNNIKKIKAIPQEELHNLSIISATVQVAISTSITFILPCIGNRTLTIVSGPGVTIGTFLIGVLHPLTVIYDYEFLQNFHLVAIWFSISAFSFGFLTQPNALLGELFSIEMLSITSIPVIVSFLVNCFMIQLHSYLYSALGGFIYLFYSLMGASGTYLVYIFMPETVGKTLEHIRSQFLWLGIQQWTCLIKKKIRNNQRSSWIRKTWGVPNARVEIKFQKIEIFSFKININYIRWKWKYHYR